MKKLILLLVLILCMAVGAKELSESEKKEVLKQFVVFQEAIKNKDDKVLASMIDFSGKSIEEEVSIVFLLEVKGEKLEGISFGTPLTKKIISSNIGRISESLKDVTLIEVEPNTLKIKDYFKDGATDAEKKRKYIYDEEEQGYYYKDKNNKKVYLSSSRIWDEEISTGFMDENFIVYSTIVPNKLTPRMPAGEGGMVFRFTFKDGKLKLRAMYIED